MALPLFVPYLFFILLFPIFSFAQSNGSVAVGTSLSADENSSPWLSPSGDFAFGFKQLQENDQFLFSIWFNKIPDRTVVWYPNATNPIVPRGSSVRVDSDSGLVLLNPQNEVLWSTRVRANQGYMNDTGNFILKGSDGGFLWESFNVYSDTLLPGQELRKGGVVNSRQSEKNFSNNRFSLRFQNDGNLVITSQIPGADDNNQYYKSETVDDKNTTNSGTRAGFNTDGTIYVMRGNGEIETLSPVLPNPSSYYLRAKVEFDGVFILYSHPRIFTATTANWTVEWSEPENICTSLTGVQEQSGACGYNSICDIRGGRPVCNCPIAYHFVDPNNKYGDCQPNFTASCDKEGYDVVMLEQPNVDWPKSDYFNLERVTEEGCKQACLDDCLCDAVVFYVDKCWKKKMPLSNGKVDATRGAFIKSASRHALPEGSNSEPEEKERWVIIASVLGGCSLFVLVLILAFIFDIYLRYQKKYMIIATNSIETSLCCFTFQELADATRKFGEELGSGSFGVVYKGELAMRSKKVRVAVKKLKWLAKEKEFRAEVNSIGQTNHKNLVRLLGFCDEGKHRLLVYEYMSNGSLASFLFSEIKPSWSMRKEIAIGIARGLGYLHEECSVQIIHCDIKPENILLDENYNVRIADFGLAKLVDSNQSRASLVTNVRGTKGYIAPEWFSNSQITAKVDVYSFGVLLLEIISCRKCINQVKVVTEDDWEVPLTDLAWDCFEQQSLDSFVGNDLEVLEDERMLERFVMVGLWCIQESSSLRPSMRNISLMLEGILEVEIPPCPSPVSTLV